MARFVETFKDWIVSFPNRYKIIEDGQEKTVEIERDWEPDVEGTSNNERVMNELVKNITYDTDTVHTTESGTSVYICDLVGMKEFTEYSSSDSSFIPKISAQINTTNSNQLSKIRISGKDGSVSDYDLYTINNGVYSLLGANKLKPNTIVIIKIVSNGANKIAVVQYLMDDKLDKGTYSGNATTLKADIDNKVSKSGDTMTGVLTISNSKYPEVIFNNSELAAVGYSVGGKSAYLRAAKGTSGLSIYSDNTAKLQANNLNTKNKEVVAAINELNDNKLDKGTCPYSIGDIYITTLSTNPATKYLGTTWEKIEGRFLLATSGSNASGQTGGSNIKTIAKANLPNIKLQVDSFTLTTQPHTHPITFKSGTGVDNYPSTYASNYSARNINTGEGGGQNTGTASPFTSALGSGTPLDITPSFYTVHVWKRLT